MFSSVMKKFGQQNKEKSKEYSRSKSRSLGNKSPKTPRLGLDDDTVTVDSTMAERYNAAKVKTVSVSSTTNIAEEVATIFSEGEDELCVNLLKEHIQTNRRKADPKTWFMLMDIYQIHNKQEDFNNIALEFAQVYSTSPPSWFGSNTREEKEMAGGGQNMLILEPVLRDETVEKFRAFLRSAKDEHFCRINVSQCKFEQNDIKHIEKLLKLFTDLRRAKVTSILMGDNALTKFCKTYISPEPEEERTLKPEFLAHEQTIWLLYLEILQWKGQEIEFEDTALAYAEKFEISPPGWESDGVMSFKPVIKELTEEDIEVEFEKNLNSNNIDQVLNFINEKFELNENALINCSKIDRIDFGAAGAISFHIQELWSNPENIEKRLY